MNLRFVNREQSRFSGGTSGTFVFPVQSGDDVPKFEPTCPERSRRETWLNFRTLDKSIRELRAMYKAHPEWFEVPKPKSDKGQNAVDYSI